MNRQHWIDSPEPEYTVIHYAHCGMSIPLCEREDLESARQALARWIRHCRRIGCGIVGPELKGERREYEILEPEAAGMVPDEAGTVVLKRSKVRAFACWPCGDLVPEGSSCSCQDEEN